ncbi:hypothetical protein N7530_011848 [Penicillium desertorum]|uniref:P-loop containing nucleoside triphosphate hydrolase protein n=1 Tax=Penicillium desertorum TaxID=1303715 RepID=A0A9W9WEB1_9EURO|nr:hypothetical protein N7530_011848 [Penicillium desertorum]
MSRKVDQMPMPAEVLPMKIIVASPSRSGTLGLYQAMRILGYKTYHFYECITVHGLPHMEICSEAITAQYNRLSGVKKYNRADYDKWLGDYDCLVEIPSMMGPDLIEAYIDDPGVKFILTERNPDKWATSVNNTAGVVIDMPYQFPFSILKYFDATLYRFLAMNELVYRAMSGCTGPGDAENAQNLRKHYTDYIKKVKEIIPADRLCYIRLEDGLDWENICPFLGVPIPEEAYPGRNEPEKFQKLVHEFLQPKMMVAVMRLSAVAVPAIGILGWAAVKYGPPALAELRSL